MLADRIARRSTGGGFTSTKGTVAGVQGTPPAVWVTGVAGAGPKSMAFTSGFQRSWAELGDQIVGQQVMVSFLDDGQPVVVDVILGGN